MSENIAGVGDLGSVIDLENGEPHLFPELLRLTKSNLLEEKAKILAENVDEVSGKIEKQLYSFYPK